MDTGVLTTLIVLAAIAVLALAVGITTAAGALKI
jgi:hypothetical protein